MNGDFNLRMRDFVTFKVSGTDKSKRYLSECRDSDSESGYSLLTTLTATHSGLVNGNMRFYRPDYMMASTHTWTDKKFAPPMLLRHDDDCDPLGRVATAKYIDLSWKYRSQHDAVSRLLFYDSSSKKMDLFKSVNWVYENLQRRNKDFEGLGYIELGVNITNPDAIAKIQREEYATTSVGFDTNAAICSICHQDWSTDGKCEHRLGEVVDGDRMFLISGHFNYREASFVNSPADIYAGVTSKEVVTRAKDSMALRVFLLGHSFQEDEGLLRATDSTSAECCDMLGADIEFITRGETEMNLDSIKVEVSAADLTKERAVELRSLLDSEKGAKRILSTLNARIRKEGWDKVENPELDKTVLEAKIAGLTDALAAMAEVDRPAYVAALEADALAFGLDVPAVDLTPVTPEPFTGSLWDNIQVKETCKDSKCSDAIIAHVDCTRKIHEGFTEPKDKSRFRDAIGTCMNLMRAEGYLEYAKASIAKDQRIEAFSTDAKEHQETLDHVNKTLALHDSLDADDKSKFRYCMDACVGVMYAESWMHGVKTSLAEKAAEKDEDQISIPKAEYETLHDGIEAFQADLDQKTKNNASLYATNKQLMLDYKRSIATSVVMYSVLNMEAGFAGLTKDQIEAEITERSSRQLVSLKDSLKDLQKKIGTSIMVSGEALLPATPVSEPLPGDAAAAATDGQVDSRAINDSATVEANTAEHPPEAQADGVAPRGSDDTAASSLVRDTDGLRQLRQRNVSELYQRIKDAASPIPVTV